MTVQSVFITIIYGIVSDLIANVIVQKYNKRHKNNRHS